jgi:hypothetical protein
MKGGMLVDFLKIYCKYKRMNAEDEGTIVLGGLILTLTWLLKFASFSPTVTFASKRN